MNKRKEINNQSGAAMLVVVIFFLFISLAIISGLMSPTIRTYQDSSVNLKSKNSYYLAESGSEDATYRLINTKTIGNSETITIDANSETTTITTNGNQKQIISSGDVSSYQRKITTTLVSGAGIGLNYGIQSGTGGFTLSGGSKIVGNVYANGNIQATNKITGTAISSGTTSFIGDNANPNDPVTIGTGIVGDLWAYKAIGTKVLGNLYCQIGIPSQNNNKSCNTSKGIPPVVDMPYTQANIDAWKADGTAGGIITGSTNCHGGYSGGNCTVDWANGTFGPGKITGNLTVNGGGTLTLTGTVYVVGTITVTGGGKIKLPANFNEYSATLISDGIVSLSGGSYTGSGAPGSYVFVVTTSSASNAITVSGGSGAIAVVAQNGTVALSGGININSAVGKTITVVGGSTVTYDQGLASPSFSSGPSGAWGVDTWKETQ